MNPGKINGANHIFGDPPGWDHGREGQCGALPVLNTGQQLQSAWYPSPDEMAALTLGCPVILSIWGQKHPVVSIGVAPIPEAAQMMCEHGATAAEGCRKCEAPENSTIPDDQVAPTLFVPPPRKKQRKNQ